MQNVDVGKDAFRAWLEANRTAIVGYRSSPSACAYAKFLVDRAGAYTASVGVARYVVTRLPLGMGGPIDSKVEVTPPWLTKFIARFDAGGKESQVTGEEALKFLEAA